MSEDYRRVLSDLDATVMMELLDGVRFLEWTNKFWVALKEDIVEGLSAYTT